MMSTQPVTSSSNSSISFPGTFSVSQISTKGKEKMYLTSKDRTDGEEQSLRKQRDRDADTQDKQWAPGDNLPDNRQAAEAIPRPVRRRGGHAESPDCVDVHRTTRHDLAAEQAPVPWVDRNMAVRLRDIRGQSERFFLLDVPSLA